MRLNIRNTRLGLVRECVCSIPLLEPIIETLRVTFSSIEDADFYVGDSTNVANWNTFFDLPTNGNPFTSVEIIGNEVRLFGGSNITLKESLFADVFNIVSIIDVTGCILVASDFAFNNCTSLTTVDLPSLTTAGDSCFYNCTVLTTVDLPSLTTAGDSCFSGCIPITSINLPELITAGNGCFSISTGLVTINLPSLINAGSTCFQGCIALTTINIPSCTNLGGTVADDFVFSFINGNTITATFHSLLETNYTGNPDGDIQYLDSNNTVTITYV